MTTRRERRGRSLSGDVGPHCGARLGIPLALFVMLALFGSLFWRL